MGLTDQPGEGHGIGPFGDHKEDLEVRRPGAASERSPQMNSV